MMDGIKVLDHGYVRLFEHMGNDLSIVRNARVSYDAAWRTGDNAANDERLIRYLMKNHHTTPFEAVTFTFDIKAPIFVVRQWHRHRTWSYNEVSARYTALPEEYYIPRPCDITTQSTTNKQARTTEQHADADAIEICLRGHCQQAFRLYQDLLNAHVPRELARTVLPLATYTHFFGTVDLHNLFHFLRLRLHPHAQYEIREYAQALLTLIAPIVPVAVAAFTETFDGPNEK